MSIHVWRGIWNAVKKHIISLSWYISGPWPRDWNPCSMAHTELKKKLPTKGKKYSWKCQTFPSINVSAFIPFVLRHIIHGERSLTYDSWSTVEVWDECGVSKWNRRESLRGSVNSAWWMSSKSFVLHLGSRLLPTRGPILNTYWVLMEHTAIIHHRTKDVVLELGCVKD